MPKRFVLILITLIMPSICDAIQVRISDDVIFVVEKPDWRMDKEMRRLLKAIDTTTNSLAKYYSRDDRILCKIYFTENRQQARLKLKTKRDCRITLPFEADLLHDIKLQTTLINIILLAKLDLEPDKVYKKVPKWLTAALWNKVNRKADEKPVLGPVTYPAMHYLTINGKIPGLYSFVNYPLLTKDGPLYLFYAEGCEILLNFAASFKGTIKNSLKEYLRLTFQNPRNKLKNFKQTIIKYIDEKCEDKVDKNARLINDSTVDHLFYHYFRDKTVNYFMPGNANYAKKILAENTADITYKVKVGEVDLKVKRKPKINVPDPKKDVMKKVKKDLEIKEEAENADAAKKEPVKEETESKTDESKSKQVIVKKDEKTGIVLEIKNIPVKKLASVWKDVFNKKEVISILKKRFSSMRYSLPVTFYDAFEKYNNAFNELGDDDVEDYTVEMTEAEQCFQQCYKKQKKLEAYLKKVEAANIPPGRRFRYLQEADKVINARQQKVWPKLIKYLDDVEKRYNE